ncbi:MAG: FAD/NAD(P)-binding protein [Bryobacteraceae bacterium]|jgi:NAD(P)H-flavin reductase
MTAGDPMAPIPAQVQKLDRENHDTFTLHVAAPGATLPPFQPGQFDMLYVHGTGELPISVSGDPEARFSLTYTVRSVGKATNKLVTSSIGDWIGVRGPYGVGWPLDKAKGSDVLLIAGGIGLAPLRPALYQMFRYRPEYGRIILAYGARSPGDMVYRNELAQWKKEPRTQVLSTVDYGGLRWRGNVGVVTTLLTRVRLDPPHTIALICGPEIMMRFAAMALEGRGIPRERIYVSMERNMKCAVGHCGHCQFGPYFVCRDGPVFPYTQIEPWINRHEI